MATLELVVNNGTLKAVSDNLRKPVTNDFERMLAVSDLLKNVEDSKLRNELQQAVKTSGWSYALRCNQ